MSHHLYNIEGGSGDLAGRLVELSTQKEDLQYQLSCCQGQLETHVQRAESAEVTNHHHGTCSYHHSNTHALDEDIQAVRGVVIYEVRGHVTA